MIGFYLVLFGGISLVAGIVTMLDWFARRQKRRAHRSSQPS